MGNLRGSFAWRDVLLAVGVVVLAQVEIWSAAVVGGPRLPVAVTAAAMGLALAFRRRAPTAALVVVFAALVAIAGLGVDSNTFFAPLIALVFVSFSAGYYARRPVLALLAAEAIVAIAVVEEKGLSPADLLYAGAMSGAPWLAGRALAARQLRVRLSEQRAAYLEQEAQWNAATAVANERARIARELHDIVAHGVSVMILHVGGVRRLLRPDQLREREALLAVERTGREALDELQRLLGVLRAPDESQPRTSYPRLTHAADLLELVRADGLAADLRVVGTPVPLPPGVDLSAYRILQEAVTNVVRHADATRVDCTIRYDDGAIHLDVVNDGRPHRYGEPLPGGGHGLVGMRERVGLYGGTLDAGPVAGSGYRVTATLRIPSEI